MWPAMWFWWLMGGPAAAEAGSAVGPAELVAAGLGAAATAAALLLFLDVELDVRVVDVWRRACRRGLSDSYRAFDVLRVRREHRSVFVTVATSTAHLATGQHIEVRGPNKKQYRPYTPVRFNSMECELCIRVYPDPERKSFSMYMNSLKPGDAVEMKGPRGMYTYRGRGVFQSRRMVGGAKPAWKQVPWSPVRRIVCLAGGSGVTPMLQVANHVKRDPEDTTLVDLVLCNSRVGDVILHDEITELLLEESSPRGNHRGRVRAHFFISRKGGPGGVDPVDMRECSHTLTGDWPYCVGNPIREPARLTGILPPAPASDTMVLICGPRGFEQAAKKVVGGHANVIKF